MPQLPGGMRTNKKGAKSPSRAQGGASADGDNMWRAYLSSGVVDGSDRWRLLLCEGDSSYEGVSDDVKRTGARATGGGGSTLLQWRAQRRRHSLLQWAAQRRHGAARGPGARGPKARAGSGWLNVKEAGMDDVGEEATGARTALRLLSRRKVLVYPLTEVSPLIARCLLKNFSLYSSDRHFRAPNACFSMRRGGRARHTFWA
jgi:hypothetical protein